MMCLLRKSLYNLFIFCGVLVCTCGVWCGCSNDTDGYNEAIPAEIIVSTGFGSCEPGVMSRGTGSIYHSDIVPGSPLPVSIVRIDQYGTSGHYLPYTSSSPLSGELSVDAPGEEVWMRFLSPQYYLHASSPYHHTKVMAWYPPVEGLASSASSFSVNQSGAATVSFSLDGDTDVLLSDMWMGSRDDRFQDRAIPFSFRHQLCMVQLNVFTADADVLALWGRITSIYISGSPVTCRVTLPDVDASGPFPLVVGGSAVTFPSDRLADIYLNRKDPVTGAPIGGYVQEGNNYYLPIPVVPGNSSSPQSAGYAMVAPVGTNVLTLAVTTELCPQPVALHLSLPKGFLSGYRYTVTLEFTAQAVSPLMEKVEIAKWEVYAKDDVALGGDPDQSDLPSGGIGEWDENGSGEWLIPSSGY